MFKELFPKNIKRKDIIRNVEFLLKHKEGHYIVADYTASIGRDTDGKFIRTHCILHDVTDIKKSEKKLNQYKDHLEELVRERTKELEEKNTELERFNKLFVDREFRIKELRDKIKELQQKASGDD